MANHYAIRFRLPMSAEQRALLIAEHVRGSDADERPQPATESGWRWNRSETIVWTNTKRSPHFLKEWAHRVQWVEIQPGVEVADIPGGVKGYTESFVGAEACTA